MNSKPPRVELLREWPGVGCLYDVFLPNGDRASFIVKPWQNVGERAAEVLETFLQKGNEQT